MYTRYKYGRNADVVQISARGLTEFLRNSQKFRSNFRRHNKDDVTVPIVLH